MIEKIKNNIELIQTWMLCLLLFSLPFYKRLVPVFIVLFLISWLFEGQFKRKWKQLNENKMVWFLPIFFILHLLGMLYTTNSKTGWEDVSMKISLLIFPILFFSNVHQFFEIKNVIRVLKYFVWGNLVAGCVVLLIAFSHFLKGDKVESMDMGYFYYQNLSYFMHVSYFALYLCFSIAIIYMLSVNQLMNKYISILLFLFFTLLIFLLASKGGILCYLTTIITMIVYHIFSFKYKLVSFLIAALGLLIMMFLLKENPRLNSLKSIFSDLRNPKIEDLKLSSNSSNAERSFLLIAGIEVIKENFWIGVGTGDVKDEEVKKYTAMNLTKLADRRLNTHNQFIDTTIQLGIIGGAYYFFLLIFSFVFFIRKKNIIGIIFIATWMVGCLFEAMFNSQAGIIYFCLFDSFLLAIPFSLSTENIFTMLKTSNP